MSYHAASMLLPIIPEAYDFEGRTITRLSKRHHVRPTYPLDRYLTQPLGVRCGSLADLRRFLSGCRYAEDPVVRGRKDYWAPPEEFERTREGDCDCFAKWTWRQLCEMGLDARVVVGRAGRHGEGHAWVQAALDGRPQLIEPQCSWSERPLPRLWIARYAPQVSVGARDGRAQLFEHERRSWEPPLRELPGLAAEIARFHAEVLARAATPIGKAALALLRRFT